MASPGEEPHPGHTGDGGSHSAPAGGAGGHGGNVPAFASRQAWGVHLSWRPMAKPTMPVTGDPEADRLLVEDPLARLIGMLLDQHMQ